VSGDAVASAADRRRQRQLSVDPSVILSSRPSVQPLRHRTQAAETASRGCFVRYWDSLTNLVQFDGQTYMAPEFGKWGSYLYDQQYLEQQGFESPPDTWDEVLEQGEQLASDDKAGFAFTWSDKSVFTFKQFLYQAGGQLFNDSNEPTFVEEGVEVLEFFDQLRERNIIPDGMSSLGEGGSVTTSSPVSTRRSNRGRRSAPARSANGKTVDSGAHDRRKGPSRAPRSKTRTGSASRRSPSERTLPRSSRGS